MSQTTTRSKPENERKKAIVAFAISVVCHLVIILGLAFFLSKTLFLRSLEPADDEPVELTIIPPPEPPKTQYVDSTDAVAAEKPPDNTPFESDRDTAASSPLPASGQEPIPTQDGEESRALQFTNREDSLGPQARSTSPTAPSQPTNPSPAAKPEPDITPRQTTQLALLEPPKPKNPPRETQSQVSPQEQPPAPAQKDQPAQPAQPPGYQPQTRITRLRGNLSNRGRSSIAAQATPLGRYNKMVSDAIGSRWYFYVRQQMSLVVPGTVEIRFTVTTDGKATQVKVLRNSSNESFAACSIGSIVDAEIPPIPPEIVPMLEGGRLEIDFTFSIIP